MPKSSQIAVLTEEEIEILRLGREDPDIITDYFFRPKGASSGWNLDQNFSPEGAWQKTVHHASQKRIVVIGGFGTGKTRGVAISACVHALTTRDFAFLNAAPRAWQSELMYKFLLSASRSTPFARLIYSAPQRPYPSIELRFMVGPVMVVSTLEFMSVDKNATQILSWEGDWVNIDEAGMLDNLGEAITNLGSRLRGSVAGRPRLGRLSLISNSWDNPELWYRYDLAAALPDDYLSITVSTVHNKNVTEDQLRMMLKDIPEEEHERFIHGSRPEGRGNYFAREKIYACESKAYDDIVIQGVNAKTPGYTIGSIYGAGVVAFTIAAVPGHSYMVLGDPGTDMAPNRNAPCLMVWDVTDFPSLRASLVGFWWGAGHGSLTPFFAKLLRFMEIYNPIFTGVDNTGPQKGTVELMNTYIKSNRMRPEQRDDWYGGIDLGKILYPTIGGLDFSAGRKPAYLTAGRLMIEAELMVWPKFVVGMRSQLSNYDPEKDRANEPKFPQDLVATFCMAAYAIRAWFAIDPATFLAKMANNHAEPPDKVDGRTQRSIAGERSVRAR